jgi:hypothetical protein
VVMHICAATLLFFYTNIKSHLEGTPLPWRTDPGTRWRKMWEKCNLLYTYTSGLRRLVNVLLVGVLASHLGQSISFRGNGVVGCRQRNFIIVGLPSAWFARDAEEAAFR